MKSGLKKDWINQSYKHCFKVLNSFGAIQLKYIRNEFKTRQLCILAFRRNIFSISHIPPQYCNQEMWLKIIKYQYKNYGYINTEILDQIPYNYDNTDFWAKAIKINVKILRIIPENEICNKYIIAAYHSYWKEYLIGWRPWYNIFNLDNRLEDFIYRTDLDRLLRYKNYETDKYFKWIFKYYYFICKS